MLHAIEPRCMLRIPTATYRLQFNAGFTFADAGRIAGYLAELGISDIYASPILRPREGSTHGYDVVDATALNPALGSDEDLATLDAELKRHGLGFLLDTVPNHMAASADNEWWMSVLENGPRSRYIHFFDIDWSQVPVQGKNVPKVLLPILGRPYGEAVESQEIRLGYERDGFFFSYFAHRLPVSPDSYALILSRVVDALPQEGAATELRELIGTGEPVINSRFVKETLARLYESDPQFREVLDATIEVFNGKGGDPESFNALDHLLDEQWYRLAYWRIASEKINYRRFFDVTDLVGVRMENPEVFEARNRKVFELIAEGRVTGLRLDHIDGLYDPIGHVKKLQSRLQPAVGESHDTPAADRDSQPELPFYIVMEKILAHDEQLPDDFLVSGTTGYDALDVINNVFVDGGGLAQLDRFYRDFTGETNTFGEISYQRKKQVIQELFSGEMRKLGKQISALALLDRNGRDFPPSELLAALTEITASMGIYRTYIRDFDVRASDREAIQQAIAAARGRADRALDPRLFDLLERMLLVDPPPYVQEQREEWLAFVMRWQQFTGRVMAKGVEDTAFYNYHRLVSLNEVGGEPGRDPNADGLEEFHHRNERVAARWPGTMNATSTHDTKRSEDARARINVLSELAGDWQRQVRRWSAMNAPHRRGGVPDPNVELMIYENLAGVWPLDDSDDSLPERFRAFLEKASREAKTHSSWIVPDSAYEDSLRAFSDALLQSDEFRSSFARFQRHVSFFGFLNALAQSVLKITAPGVPDFYQGMELWDFSLVDPDNRRPVDYEARAAMLAKMKKSDGRGALKAPALLRRWADGRLKMFVTWKSLDCRSRNAEVFRHGGYTPLRAAGANVCAFARGDSIIVAVPRLLSKVVKSGKLPVRDVWGERAIEHGGRWRNAFTGETVEGDRLALRDVFATFPLAILERVS